uniref:Uncharacterized protein n=1 Tax=Solanum lycopersicum TaxID=4081 RepID=A0A3Q7HDG9_SOLLC
MKKTCTLKSTPKVIINNSCKSCLPHSAHSQYFKKANSTRPYAKHFIYLVHV